jgi:hypothetical protein
LARSRKTEEEDVLDRRSFLSITAGGILRGVPAPTRNTQPTEDYWKTLGYEVARVLPRVNQVYVQRDEESRGLRVECVDFETTPDGDVSLLVPCGSAEPSLYISGSAGYELTLWLQQRTSDLEAFIALESAATVRLLAHPERGHDLVVMMEENRAAMR